MKLSLSYQEFEKVYNEHLSGHIFYHLNEEYETYSNGLMDDVEDYRHMDNFWFRFLDAIQKEEEKKLNLIKMASEL